MELGQTFDLGRVYAAGETIKGARQENQLRQQQLGAQQVFQDTAKAAVDPQTGQYSPSKHAEGLTAAGYPQAAQQLLTQQVETADKFLTYAGRVLPFMNEQSYPAIKKQLEAGGMPPGMLPDQFDPAAVNALVTKMRSMQEDAYSAFQKLADGPGGSQVWGQTNQRTGEVKGATVMKPPTPRAGVTIQAPSATREWEYYNSLSPGDQQRYLEMKRNSERVVDIGGVPTRVSSGPMGGTAPLSTLDAETGAAATEAGAKATAEAQAKARVASSADLPRVEANASQMLGLLDQLGNSRLDLVYGLSSLAPIIPGTPQADANAIWEQVQGKAFLEAFGTLKGGGQITEKEGEKATSAITRLGNRKQSEGSARQAIQDLRNVVKTGLDRARRSGTAQGAPAAPGISPPRPPQGSPQGQPTATATGANGQRLGLINGQWVPLQ